MAPSTPRPSFDYASQALSVGDTVTFIDKEDRDPVRLFTGRIVVIRDEQICIESGDALIVRTGKRSGAYRNRPEATVYDGLFLQHKAAVDALQRIQELGNRPQAEDANNPWSEDYLRGYRHAMNGVQRAVDNPPTEDKPNPEPAEASS